MHLPTSSVEPTHSPTRLSRSVTSISSSDTGSVCRGDREGKRSREEKKGKEREVKKRKRKEENETKQNENERKKWETKESEDRKVRKEGRRKSSDFFYI